ncbi:hypothetical protein BDV24DRAFT_166090 [Aspergillus arachidicola]|uniref:Uncharacterized protein n=1 Tax=Aspergillus arachidicola TaxID=656916 RepID=A0A5N6Y2K6_9EURO|nr:hypothetical protein BDV24DRAFT_166090 [Aspergillus arachidicola]
MNAHRNVQAQGGRRDGRGGDHGAIKKNEEQVSLLWRKGAQLPQLPADGRARGLGGGLFWGLVVVLGIESIVTNLDIENSNGAGAITIFTKTPSPSSSPSPNPSHRTSSPRPRRKCWKMTW